MAVFVSRNESSDRLLEEDQALDEQETVGRVAEEIRQGVQAFNERNPGEPLGAAMPIVLTGGHPLVGEDLLERLETVEGLSVKLVPVPFQHPPDFPAQRFMVNIGLLLRTRYK